MMEFVQNIVNCRHLNSSEVVNKTVLTINVAFVLFTRNYFVFFAIENDYEGFYLLLEFAKKAKIWQFK